MLKVLRYIEIGQRKYEVGETIAQADIKAWGMDDVKVQATIAEHIARGRLEAVKDEAVAGIEHVTAFVSTAAATVEAAAEHVSDHSEHQGEPAPEHG